VPSVRTVDGDDSARATVSRFIETMGFQVAQASNGAEGLATLEECRLDLVVLDVSMPVLDGPSMLSAIRDVVEANASPRTQADGNKTPAISRSSVL
jgi:CheY-like chemotaxis protein